jgi:hypothetical protein
MPQTELLVFRNESRAVPLTEWLDDLEKTEPKAYVACLERIQQLERPGYELRRPVADSLRDGIHELRAKRGRVQYRILYFFHGKNVACMTHGFTKEGVVPDTEMARAVHAKELVESNQDRYTVEWEL